MSAGQQRPFELPNVIEARFTDFPPFYQSKYESFVLYIGVVVRCDATVVGEIFLSRLRDTTNGKRLLGTKA